MLSVSIVSHLQGDLVKLLLDDIEKYCKSVSLEVLLTLNHAETLEINVKDYSFPISIHLNSAPQGFGANHNRAFFRSLGRTFCIMNPDIRLTHNPFQLLLECLNNESVGLVAPMVLSENGTVEDSARRFPTPLKLLCKALGRCKGNDYDVNDKIYFPDWVAGMFMLFRREVFAKLGGFDEKYFLYYEDVDLCARMHLAGFKILLCTSIQVIHDARRESHRNFRYFKWHLTSIIKFFCSAVFLKIYWKKFMHHALAK
jgi:N-acetylglucosaminyl-diphospho-decaprenol L-rhamnosyltransferase